MIQLIPIGFFRELSRGAEGPSLRELVAEAAHPDEDKILAYLENGVGYAGRGEYVRDVLDPNSKYNLMAHLLTDGVHVWRSDLAYYVRTYHVRLPDEFVAYMKDRNWTVPSKSEIKLDDLQ